MAGARTTATLVVIIIGLWTVGVLARPVRAWHLALVAALAGSVVVVLAVPVLREGVFLLEVTTTGLLLAAALGAGGALLVEVVHRTAARLPMRGGAAAHHTADEGGHR